MENTRATVSGKTYPERSQAIKDTTSSPYSKPSRKLPTPKFMCLNLNKRHVGQDLRGNPLVMWMEMGGALLGEQLMMFQDICVARSFLNADEDTLIQFAKVANEVAKKRGWEKLVSGV